MKLRNALHKIRVIRTVVNVEDNSALTKKLPK